MSSTKVPNRKLILCGTMGLLIGILVGMAIMALYMYYTWLPPQAPVPFGSPQFIL